MDAELNRLYQRLDAHIDRFEEHERKEDVKFTRLVEAQQTNTDAITTLTTAVSSLVDDTSSIIQLHKDFQGAARVGSGVQRFLLWCMKWGTIGIGVATAILWLIEHFKN